MRAIVFAFCMLLAACHAAPIKPTVPAPAVIKVPVATYVPIDAALTKRCRWVRDGKPSEVFDVSNGRKRCLLQYEAQLDAVERVQGKPTPTTDTVD